MNMLYGYLLREFVLKLAFYNNSGETHIYDCNNIDRV